MEMLAHPFSENASESTGREDFHVDWLMKFLDYGYTNVLAEDVQLTLSALTAQS